MADDDSPRPFRRERNLSNRNFRRRGSNRRFSTESHSSIDSHSNEADATTTSNTNDNSSGSNSTSSVSSSFQYSYSVHTDTENAFNQKSLRLQCGGALEDADAAAPQTPDPALLGVKQKVQRFETLKSEDRIIFKTGKFNSRQHRVTTDKGSILGPLRVLPIIQSGSDGENNSPPIRGSGSSTPTTPTIPPKLPARSPPMLQTARKQISSLYSSIDEARSEDEVEDISSDFVEDESAGGDEERPVDTLDSASEIIPSITVDDEFGTTEKMRRVHSTGGVTLKQDDTEHSTSESTTTSESPKKSSSGDFKRNYRSTPRPKTEIIGTTNRHLVGKYTSFHERKEDDEEEEEEIELRNKCAKYIQPILDELINTEVTYVESLFNGIKNYGNIFTRKDLPLALQGKKYVLLGNIEQIAEFHRDEFLPMLLHNRRDLKRLFDAFQDFVEQNCFYGYVIFTMNKQKSLKLCDDNKTYFKHLQGELDDKLGINSFLVQPIQRIAKYPLLLKEFISALFKNCDFDMKPIIESCCRLDKKVRTLLTTTNESEVINDIVDCHEFNVFYQGKFRKVSEFTILDHTLRRTYRGKVFIFDKCIIYTEIKGKSLIFHGRYPCEHIGIVAKTKHFTLFYERRKQQEADFHAEPAQIELWLELIREMISSYATEERRKLQELYSRESDHKHRKPSSLSLFRDSNRFSSDSGIGNIWVMPKPEVAEDSLSNRTTWYQ